MSQADLPVPAADTRRYCRITPSEQPLDPDTVTTQLQRLHSLESPTDNGLTDRLLGADPPLIEVLLATDGDPETGVDYYIATDTPDCHDSLEGILRATFPDSYAIESVERPPPLPETDSPTAITYYGVADRPADWQTRLTPFEQFQADDHARTPLSRVIEIVADATTPAVCQCCCQPKADWTTDRDTRRLELKEGTETLGDQVVTALVGSPDQPIEKELPPEDRDRLEELADRNPKRSFDCNVRAVIAGEDTATATELATAFSEVSHTCYEIDSEIHTGEDAVAVAQRVRERTLQAPDYERLTNRLPFRRPRSPGIVADASELGGFCLVDGSALTTGARQALETTPGEREPIPLPPAEQRQPYHQAGLPLGQPLTADHAAEPDPIALPPALQPLHVGWFGKTGSGKSTALVNAILENHAATDGLDLLIDPKGDGMAQTYMRAHYAKYGSLDNVLYFDCAEVLPAFSIFDIRGELDAGVPRTTAVEDTVDHYIEMLRAIMGPDRFEQAVRSPDIIRYLLKALFDPVNGEDAFAHADLLTAARRMHDDESAPAVSDDDLERMLAGVVANSTRSFDEIMQGVANRLEKIPVDRRLATIFNHVPGPDEASFDLAEYLDEDVVVILDTGRLRSAAQRVLTLVVLSNLWTALRRRGHRTTDDDYQLVNVYLEEAASVATSEILQDLLAQSRSFGCAVTLAMQFPEQLRAVDEAVYRELLNNVSTYVVGNVPVDERLAQRLATAELSATDISNRIRALRRGEWLVGLPAPFDAPEPRPFQVQSLPLPPGHPAGSGEMPAGFDDAVEAVVDRTRAGSGLVMGSPNTTEPTAESAPETGSRLDSALPYTQRLPPTVRYDQAVHGLQCTECDNRYGPSMGGMKRAIECCGSLKTVDRDDIPICSVPVKRSADERANSEWSDRQLLFLQAVFDAQQLRHDELGYDLLEDSMLRLQEYVGIDSEAVSELQDAGLLRHDTDHPHRLYSVTPDGRAAIGESYRRGVEYGHGKGDLSESSAHVLLVELGKRYLETEYVDDPDSPVVELVPYYEPSSEETTVSMAAAMGTDEEAIESAVEQAERRRLDVAGLDEDGNVVVALEAERINNDVHRAVPEDFDKMAACGVEEAIWVVMTHSDGHQVLSVLGNPPVGEPRVEKTYAETTPPQQFRLDRSGCTAIYPVSWLQTQVEE